MEVVVTTGAIGRAKLQSNHHQQQTNIQFFYRPDALPVAQPTASTVLLTVLFLFVFKVLFVFNEFKLMLMC